MRLHQKIASVFNRMLSDRADAGQIRLKREQSGLSVLFSFSLTDFLCLCRDLLPLENRRFSSACHVAFKHAVLAAF